MTKKSIALIVLVGVLAGVFWVLAKPWISNPLRLTSNYQIWLWPLVMLAALSAAEGLAFLLVKVKTFRFLVIIVAAVPYFAVFGVSGFYILAFLLALLLQWWASENIDSQTNARIKINLRYIMTSGLSAIVTSILIMVSFAFFLSPATQAAARKQQLPSSVKRIVEKTVPLFAGEQIRNLPVSQRQTFVSQATNEIIKQFTNLLRPYFKYMPPVLAFGLFLVLQGLSFIFVWLSTAIALALFELLKRSGIIRIAVVKKETEELEF